MKVCILLATYNGAAWLNEQLESLFAQTCQDWHLHISDDGSTDGTVALLEQWKALHPDRVSLTLQPRNLGFRENFRWLLRSVEADTYFLCDQDDVWMPERVALSLDALDALDGPALVFSDLEVVDAGLNTLHPSLWAWQRTDPGRLDLRTLFVVNIVTGCTAVLNRAARNLVLDVPLEPSHDHAMALTILKAGGTLFPLSVATVKYRQHGGNSIGARPFLAGLVSKALRLTSPAGRLLARKGVEWGVFSSVPDYFLFKTGLWWKRLLKPSGQ